MLFAIGIYSFIILIIVESFIFQDAEHERK